MEIAAYFLDGTCYSKTYRQPCLGHFFTAIQFVLSADEFSNLRQEERQALLHVSCQESLQHILSKMQLFMYWSILLVN